MKICILGAGAYGLALALSFYRNNNQVTVWTKIESEKNEILNTRMNKKALPGIKINEDILITTDLSCIGDNDLIILAIPINYLRNTCLEIKNYINKDSIICIASKGIENKTNLFAHEILTSIINTKKIAILSGPTFAIDLANNCPSGLTLVTTNYSIFQKIKEALQSNTLKLTYSNDLIGIEICGAVKNIMAIISGILTGMNATETTKALFLTEATNEILLLIETMNGNRKSINTLAGIGDLLLTCNSNKSRNFTLGTLIATENKEVINNYINNNTVEGYQALISLNEIIKNKNINLKLIMSLYKILFKNLDKEEIYSILTQN